MRRKIRPWFQRTPIRALIYDVLTFITTRIAIAYLVFPFVLLEFWPSLETYRYVEMHLLLAVMMIQN